MLLQDARSIVMQTCNILHDWPLQLYYSALVFAPENGVIRHKFRMEFPSWLTGLPRVDDDWDVSHRVLEGHSDNVGCLAFSLDSRILASGSDDRTIKVWDWATGECTATLRGHDDSVTALQFLPRPCVRQLASASDDKTIKIWDAITGECMTTLVGHAGPLVSLLCLSSDQNLLLVSCDRKEIRLWDLEAGQCISSATVGMSSTINGITAMPDSGKLIAATSEGVFLCDTAWKDLRPLPRYSYYPEYHAVAVSPASKVIALATSGFIELWDATPKHHTATLDLDSDGLASIMFMSEGLLVSTSWHGFARIWSVTNYRCLAVREATETYMTPALSVSTDAKLIAISQMSNIIIWDSDIALSTPNADSNSGVELLSTRFSADSAYLARASSKSDIKLWDTRTGELIGPLTGSHDWENFDWGPDSSTLISVSSDGTIRLWDAPTGACTHTLQGFEDGESASSVNLSAGGEMIAMTSRDGIARVWGVSTGTYTHILPKDHWPYRHAAFSPDAKLLVLASTLQLQVWDLGTDQCIRTFPLSLPTTFLAISPNLRLLAQGNERTLRLWEVGGHFLCKLDFARPISNVVFDEDGSSMCTNVGRVALTSALVTSNLVSPWPRSDSCTGVWLSPDNAWITWNSRKLLWVPPQYRIRARSSTTDAKGSMVAIGLDPDRVMFISVDESALSQWMPSLSPRPISQSAMTILTQPERIELSTEHQ